MLDDYAFSGGAGMVIDGRTHYQLHSRLEKSSALMMRSSYMTPDGDWFNQSMANKTLPKKET